MISHSAIELVNLQGKISNRPKENKTDNVLKISLMRSEIKLSEEGATYYVKSLNFVGGDKLIPLPTPTCKITGKIWETVGFQPMHRKHMVPCWPSPALLLFIAKCKDEDWDKKLSVPTPKSGRVVNWNTLKVSLYLQWSFANSSYTASSGQQCILSLACC